jgi:peroxiredoxin
MLLALAESAPDIELLLVSVDDPKTWDKARALLHDLGAPEPEYVVRGPLEPFKSALNPRWPGMIPATFLYDEQGKLRYFWGGPAYENEVAPILEGFLAGKPIDGEAVFGLAPGKIVQ